MSLKVLSEHLSDSGNELASRKIKVLKYTLYRKKSSKKNIESVTVVLDHRNLRTPGKHIVQFPKQQRQLALLTAAEWDSQTQNLKAHSLPLVRTNER